MTRENEGQSDEEDIDAHQDKLDECGADGKTSEVELPVAAVNVTPLSSAKKDTAKKSKKVSAAATTNSRKRSWTKAVKPLTVVDMDREFLKTMHSLQKALSTTSPEPTAGTPEEPVDEDRHFCLSLVGQLKDLEPRYKSMAKLQIMQVMNDVERIRAAPHAQVPHQQLGGFIQRLNPLYSQPQQPPAATSHLAGGGYLASLDGQNSGQGHFHSF